MKTIQTFQLEFEQIRQQTEHLVSFLEVEDFASQPIVDVSPPKWHLGHTTWFFENFILAKYVKNYKLFDSRFNYVFNSYYVSQGDRLARHNRGTLNRPTTAQIFNYRQYVNQGIINYLNSNQVELEALKFLEIGLNHEQEHQELLITDIKYIFSQNPLKPTFFNGKKSISTYQQVDLLTVKEGLYEIGHNSDDFCFDNELGRHKVFINQFKFQNRLVSNKEYLEFIEDQGYNRAELWLSEGWDWVCLNKITAPEYWFVEDDIWKNYTVFGVQEIDWNDTLCHISFYEAEAYARWKNMRLLTEQEWEVAANLFSEKSSKNHFQELGVFHLNNAIDIQLLGSAWEWTNSAYLPYPNYNQADGALGEYNGKFMVNQMVLRGGSCATPMNHFRISYRNFFHPHLRWQFTGIRLAEKK